ncbi:S-layer homology domain-containing protein [Aliterella atlantica]|uniref:S-layer homology domain-containing protein n=1 Tax=Aliterella atlantica TaxID=1827278 RepID=UPI0005D3FD94|nr:S-layer homology domain-containing protein [Aliterella atlantica]
MLPYRRATGLVSLVLLTALTACANSPTGSNLEEILSAEPRLAAAQSDAPNRTATLPADFPSTIPLYPNAQLQEVTGQENVQLTRWASSDPITAVQSFYENQLRSQNWEILSQPSNEQTSTIEARSGDLQVTIVIEPNLVNTAPTQGNTGQQSTQFTIQYNRNSANTPVASAPQQGEEGFIGPVAPSSPQPTTPSNTTTPSSTQVFTDIDKAPAELRPYIQDLAELGVLSTQATANKSNTAAQQFNPTKTITRREYARWLFAANNQINSTRPAQQIRAASTTQSAFQDVKPSDPDFAAIQGLADAGIIPSSLSGDSSAVLFRPNAPLTREQLIAWKVPLDTRQALPAASQEAVKESWGFQDVGKIDPKALRAILADFQNSDQSNIRRAFGFTTLFQPKKPVTRAEAAAVLWYFGNSSEGISAKEVLQVKNQPQEQSNSTPQPETSPTAPSPTTAESPPTTTP